MGTHEKGNANRVEVVPLSQVGVIHSVTMTGVTSGDAQAERFAVT